MCYMSFLTSRGGIMRFSSTSSDYLWTSPCTLVVMVVRGLTFHLAIFIVWMRGRICWFFSYGGIGVSIMTVGEYYVLFDV